MPATAGGRTSGSSTSVTATAWPGKRRVASRYAVGVPNRTISACAIALVFRLTMKASRTTGFESWSSRCPGLVWAKIATIGSARNTSVTIAIATNRPARAARFIAGDPGCVRAPVVPCRLLLLGRRRLHAREEAVRQHPRLARLAQDLVDEGLGVGLVAAPRDDADPVLHLRLRPRRHLDHVHLVCDGLRVGRVHEPR